MNLMYARSRVPSGTVSPADMLIDLGRRAGGVVGHPFDLAERIVGIDREPPQPEPEVPPPYHPPVPAPGPIEPPTPILPDPQPNVPPPIDPDPLAPEPGPAN